MPDFVSAGANVDRAAWTPSEIGDALLVARPTVVFSLLGTTKKRSQAAAKDGRQETYETIDYALSKQLYMAACGCGTSPRFVYLSSMGVRENTANPYLAARAKMESFLRSGPLPFVIAQPSFITGDRDERRPGEAIGSRAADLALASFGFFGARKLQDRFRSTTGPRLARALVDLALSSETGTFDSGDLYRRGEA